LVTRCIHLVTLSTPLWEFRSGDISHEAISARAFYSLMGVSAYAVLDALSEVYREYFLLPYGSFLLSLELI